MKKVQISNMPPMKIVREDNAGVKGAPMACPEQKHESQDTELKANGGLRSSEKVMVSKGKASRNRPRYQSD